MEGYAANDLLINIHNLYMYLLDSKLYKGRDYAPYSCSPLYTQCRCSMNILLIRGRKERSRFRKQEHGRGK